MPNFSKIKTGVCEVAKKYGIKKMYLFGSFANDTATKKSDIDLLYEKGESTSLLGVSQMLLDLKEKFGKKIDLVSADCLESDFLDSVNATKVLLYERA